MAFSNHQLRIITAVVAIPIILLICILGDFYFFALVAVISTLALKEFYSLTRLKGAKPQIYFGLIAGLIINLSFFHYRLQYYVCEFFKEQNIAISFPSQSQILINALIFIVIFISAAELLRNNGSPIINLASTFFGLLYISLFFGTLIGLREIYNIADFPVLRYFNNDGDLLLPKIIYNLGGYTVITVFAAIWICDTAAFYGGKLFGRHKLFPRISPNKTWEGAVFGFIFAIIATVLAKYLVLSYLKLSESIIIGSIVGTVGQFGDLIESMFKRDVGVKDSSAIVPGHGGILDRFDSMILVSPVIYLYLDYVVFG